MNIERKNIYLLLSGVLFSLFAGLLFANENPLGLTRAEAQWLEENNEIIFISQSHYPPFEFVNEDNRAEGMCIELSRWIATEAGFKAHFRDMSFIEAQEALESGEADVLTSLFYSRSRDIRFDFTEMTWEVPALIFVRQERPEINELDDLQNKKVAMQRGDYAEEFLRINRIECTLILTETFGEAVEAVAAGTADALIGDEQIVLYYIFSKGMASQIKSVGKPLYIGRNSMAVREDRVHLRAILDKGLRSARERGVVDRITTKWTGTRYTKPPLWYSKYLKFLLSAVGLMVVLILGISLWNIQLRRAASRMARELHQNELLLRALFNSIPDLLWMKDSEGRYLGCNPSFEDFFGVTEAEILGKTDYDFISPAVADTMKSHDAELAQASGVFRVEQPIKFGDMDREIIMETIRAPLYAEKDSTLGILGFSRDITKRKQIENLLKIQRDFGQALGATGELNKAIRICLDAALAVGEVDCGGIYIRDLSTGDLNLVDHCGLPDRFVEEVSHFSGDSPQTLRVADGNSLFSLYDTILESMGIKEEEARGRECAHIRAIGILPILNQGSLIGAINVGSQSLDEFSKFTIYSLEAITAQAAGALARIHADNVLKMSQKNLQEFFNNIGDFVFVLGTDSRLIHWNPVVEARLGYTPEELSGMMALELHHEEQQQEAQQILGRMQEGKANSSSIPLYTASGESIPVETRVSRGLWDGQDVVFGISRDITELKRSEDNLRRTLQEKEILLKEIHHRVKNNLQVVTSLLSLQADSIEDKEALEAFAQAEGRVASMALVHESLYQSANFSEIRLQEYLEKLGENLLYVFAGPMVELAVHAEGILIGIEQAVPCGLILTELMTNAYKHAFPDGREGRLEISVECADNHIKAVIADNGVGLPADVDPRESRSLGLRLLTSLVEEQLEGRWEYSNHNGTVWTLMWPLNERKESW